MVPPVLGVESLGLGDVAGERRAVCSEPATATAAATSEPPTAGPVEVAAVASELAHPRSSARTASTAPRELHGRASASARVEVAEVATPTATSPSSCSSSWSSAAAIAGELVTRCGSSSSAALAAAVAMPCA